VQRKIQKETSGAFTDSSLGSLKLGHAEVHWLR